MDWDELTPLEKQTIDLQMNTAIERLNKAFGADPVAIWALLCNRVPCNQALADDPYVIVERVPIMEDKFTVGTLGLMNGLLDSLELPLIASKWSEPDKDGRCKLLGFCRYEKPKEL